MFLRKIQRGREPNTLALIVAELTHAIADRIGDCRSA